MDRALRERDRRMRLVFKQIPGAIWATDRDLRITYAVGQLREATGLDDSHIVGTTISDLIGTSEPTDVAVAHHRAALAGQSTWFRYDFRGRSYEVHAEPMRDHSAEVVGCVGVAVDITDRAKSDAELMRQQTWLADAQRAAHVGSWEWDVERDTVLWSDELYRIYGREKSDQPMTYRSFAALIHPDDADQTKEVIFEALRTGQPFSHDHRILRPDGEIRVLHTLGKLGDPGQGGPVGGQVSGHLGVHLGGLASVHNGVPAGNHDGTRMYGVCWDFTTQYETTRALEHSVSLLRATLEATADGLLVVDLNGKIVAHSQSFLSMWRISPGMAKNCDDQMLRSAVVEQLEDPEGFTARVHELYQAPDLESFDILHFKDGRVFERSSRPQRLGDAVVGRVWSFSDVTDRERLFRRAVFLSDASRLLSSLDVEPALESVARLALPFLGEAVAVDLLAEEGGPRRLLSVAREPFEPISGEPPRTLFGGHSSTRASGGRVYLTVPLMARGSPVGALTFAAPEARRYGPAELDLAEELARRAALAIDNARLYRRASEALAAREQFLSIAAHEIRGPLTSLQLAMQSLRRNRIWGAADTRLFDVIERDERRLARFVDELLDVSRARSSQLHLDFQEVDLSEIVRDVAARFGPDLARSGSSLTMTTGGPIVGLWDPMRLNQVVTNLLSNAIKFGGGQPIEISTSCTLDTARLVIKDHGIGIAPEAHERIFRPFERAVSVRHYSGIGLGLHIVKAIVEAFGGSVDVESALGSGATFIIRLPRSRGA